MIDRIRCSECKMVINNTRDSQLFKGLAFHDPICLQAYVQKECSSCRGIGFEPAEGGSVVTSTWEWGK